jgi:aminocarboxymuconate-semialdehyde decarboxylase
MRIDVHTHYLPAPFLDRLREWGESVRVEDRDGEPYLARGSGGYPLTPGFVDLEARAAWMDDHDVDMTVASVSSLDPNGEPFSVEQTKDLTRALNAGYADAQAAYPDRFVGLASLPFRDQEAAVEELDRAIDEYSLGGVAIPTTIRGRKRSAPEFEPVFDRIDERGVPVFVHPGTNALSRALDSAEGGLNPTVIFPIETTVQLARLIFDGFFDRYGFPVLLSHMGGALPYLVGRLERGRQRFRLDPGASPDHPVIEYVSRFHYDAISFHAPAVAMVLDLVGADHLLFGTDYPFDMERIEETVADIETVAPTPAAEQTVMGGAAVDLFDL